MVLPNPFYDPSGGLPDVRDPFGGSYENSGEGPGRPEGGGGGAPPFDPNLTSRFYSPSTRASLVRYSNTMPFPLSVNRAGLLGSIIQTAGNIVGGFLPGPQVTVGPGPGADWCREHPGDVGCIIGSAEKTAAQILAEQNARNAMMQGGALAVQGTNLRRCSPCSLARPVKATTRNYRGRWCMNAQGQPVCIPARRRMNPGNARAALRAARRLKGVFRFQKRVEKALARAVRGSGIGRHRRTTTKSCRKCA